jgi:polyhydroxyalkanoate synthesis regulator phasin
MTTKKTDTVKDKFNEAEDFARKIWLAGLGAYGKSVEEAQGRYDKLSAEASKMFDDLVSKGENLEDDARSKFKSTTSDVENRVSEVRKKLGLDSEPSDQRIEELSAKVDALTEAVAKLAANSNK